MGWRIILGRLIERQVRAILTDRIHFDRSHSLKAKVSESKQEDQEVSCFRKINWIVAIAIVVMHCSALRAQIYLYDSFDSDDLIRLEDTELQQRTFGAFGAMEFDDGNLLLATEGASYFGIASNRRLERGYRDFSLQTQVRAVELPDDWMFAGMLGRFLRQDNDYGSYYIGIGTDSNQIRYGESSANGSIDEIGIDVPFDVRESDVRLRLDMIGPVVRGWAWEAGDMQPDQPLFEFEDESVTVGSIGFWVNTDGSRGEAAFDWFSVAPLPAGDFDGSGELTAHDIDHVASRVRDGSDNLIYDLDQNGNFGCDRSEDTGTRFIRNLDRRCQS